MENLIKVIYNDKSVGRINERELKKMIEEGKIASFCREEGWVHVNLKPLRGKGGTYTGPERRRSSTEQTRQSR